MTVSLTHIGMATLAPAVPLLCQSPALPAQPPLCPQGPGTGACRGWPGANSQLQLDGDREEGGKREVRCKCRPENRSGASGSDAWDGREASAK